MTLATAAIPTPTVPHSTAPGEVRVWDRFVRLFHWSLVVLVAVAAVTGFLAPPWWIGLHLGAGTAIAALVFARVVWGFVGSGHARFADFVVGPRAVLAHLTGRHERAPATLGHNPLGGWMILALIAALTALTATGMTALGGELKSGPLAFATSFRLGTTAGEIHAVLAIGLLGLVAAHVGGALFESLRTRENLVRSMITGAKRRRAGMAVPAPIAARRGLALATIAGGWSLAAVVVVGFAARPGLGLPPTTVDPLIVAECGACHFAYPPSLLPRASWAALLTGLDDHFGENATLPAETVAVIAARLEAGAAESADTRAANRFRLTAPDAPFTLTATPYWKRRHAGLEDTVFARAEIGGRGNCGACHGDAAAGRFHPGRIAIPSPSSEGSTP